MGKLNFTNAETFILLKLKDELPDSLTYHGIHHTLDVVDAAVEIADEEGVGGEELILLKTAALYHDSGFTRSYQGHEEVGCAIAREFLPRFGYSEEQITMVCGMILATRIPQSPKNLLEKILCDADLYYLGRNDFYPVGHTLFQEFLDRGVVSNEQDWNRLQIKFLESHHYFTDTAIRRRNSKKQQHLREVRALVARYAA
ncbi:MAG: HD domain-containing protein [Bacteroidia bacterium]|nr:HD domain-containing protein [Bacteroidia bacterium]